MDVIVDLSKRIGKPRDQGNRGTCLVVATTVAHELLYELKKPLCIEWLYYYAIKIAELPLGSWTTVQDVSVALKEYGQPFEET